MNERKFRYAGALGAGSYSGGRCGDRGLNVQHGQYVSMCGHNYYHVNAGAEHDISCARAWTE